MFLKHRCIVSPMLAWLALSGSRASAQSFVGQWHGDLYSVILTSEMPPQVAQIDARNTIRKIIPHVSKAGSGFPIKPKFLATGIYSYWRNDALYTLVHGSSEREGNGPFHRRHTYAKWEDDEWHFLGSYMAAQDVKLKAIPCDNDSLIVISSDIDLVDNKREDRSPFAKMSFGPGQSELRLGASIGHGQEELQNHMSNPNCFNLASSSSIVMTDKHAAVISYGTGLYWVFSLEDAALVKAGNIFKMVTPEMIAKGGFVSAILLAQPEKAGTVLIAAQEEEFLIINNSDPITNEVYVKLAEMRPNDPDMTQEKYIKELKERVREQRTKGPFIAWYRLHPEDGSVEKLEDPPRRGAKTRRNGHSWRPMPDGSVRMEVTERVIYENQQRSKSSRGSEVSATSSRHALNPH